VTDIYVGNTAVNNPYIMLVIDGVAYPSGYRINYNAGYRNLCGAYDTNTGNVFVRSQGIAYGEPLPAYNLNNLEVLVIGRPLPLPEGNPVITNVTSYNFEGDVKYQVTFNHIANATGYNIYWAYTGYENWTLTDYVYQTQNLPVGTQLSPQFVPDIPYGARLTFKVVALSGSTEYGSGTYNYG
jgi:hypothetical protein